MFSWWFVKAATKKQSTHSGNHNHVSNKYTSSQKNVSHYLITFDYQQSIIFKSRQKKQTLFHPFTNVVVNERTLGVPGGSVRGERANLKGLVLGCIEAKFCKKICVGKLSPRSAQCTPLHSSKITCFVDACIHLDSNVRSFMRSVSIYIWHAHLDKRDLEDDMFIFCRRSKR